MALEHPLNQTIYLEEAKVVAEELIAFAKEISLPTMPLLDQLLPMLEDPGKTLPVVYIKPAKGQVRLKWQLN